MEGWDCDDFILCNGRFMNLQNIIAEMIKNRTSEFKLKYSASQPKESPLRPSTPQYLKNKFAATGFTDFSISTNNKQKSTRKLAKVESNAFIRKKKLSEFCLQADTYSRKYIDNSTSLCQYLDSKKIEKPYFSKYRLNPDQDDTNSQQAISQSQKNLVIESCQPQSQMIIKAIADLPGFFTTLTPRSLFFCCKCFKYIFAIEKSLHYPKCQNQINISQLNVKEKAALGWERLQLMKELSEYTNFKQSQIAQIYSKMKKKQAQGLKQVVIEPNVEYLPFQGVLQAFMYVCEVLLSQESGRYSGIFSMRKIFSCMEPQRESGLFEKKLFG